MLNKKPGLRAAVLLSAGILTYHFCRPGDTLIITASLATLTLLLIISFFKNTELVRDFSIIFLLVLCGILRAAYSERELAASNHLMNLGIFNKYVVLDGWITDKQVYPKGNTSITVNIISLTINGRQLSNIKGKVKLYTDRTTGEYSYGDRLAAGGLLIDFRPRRNPGEVDFRAYYHKQGIFAELRLPEGREVVFRHGNYGNSILRKIIFPLKTSFSGTFEELHSGMHLEFMKAIVLGERSGLDREILEEFRDSGTIHILAVSGLHIGFVVLIFSSILMLFNVPKLRILPFFMIFIIVFYMILTGARPPVMRAGIFMILYYISIIAQRRRDILNLLGSTAFILLIIDPNDLLDPGFQLSFAAVLGIIFSYKELKSQLMESESPVKKSLMKRIGSHVLFTFFISFGAVLGTAIISAYHFNRIVPGAIILNLAAVPLAGMIVCLGFIELIFGSFSVIVGGIFSNTTEMLMDILFFLNGLFSKTAFLRIDVGHREAVWTVFSVIFVLSVYFMFRYEIKKKKLIIPILVCVFLVWGKWLALPDPNAKIAFIDVGQGDATLISMPDKTNWLIDGGGSIEDYSSGERHVLPFLRWNGIRRLNGVFITHFNRDHYGGILEILKAVKCDTLYFSSKPDLNNSELIELNDMIIERRIPVRILKTGDIIQRNNTYNIVILSPDQNTFRDSRDLNEASLVIKLNYGSVSFLFTGDIGYQTEKNLLQYGKYLKSDVLKVAHHGSKNSSSSEFLDLVGPEYSVIHVGRFNSFGHPSEEAVARLKNAGSELLRTDESGAIIFSTDGRKINLIENR
ncbi:DNA internalization-related competence protein ComEC/Rec2 [candidate division KSB1 bacterium]